MRTTIEIPDDLFRNAMQDYLDMGIRHASDDIGAGNSDLERVMELHPGFLKIDIGLVHNIDKNYLKQEVIKSMVQLAKGINSVIIAEGVERPEEYWKLKELGVAYGQGYLFGKPLPELHGVSAGCLEKLSATQPIPRQPESE